MRATMSETLMSFYSNKISIWQTIIELIIESNTLRADRYPTIPCDPIIPPINRTGHPRSRSAD